MRLPPRLLALSPGTLAPADRERFVIQAARAVAAGLRGLLLREPALGDRATLELAQALRARLDAASEPGWLGLHDRVHLAREAGADAVHLGFRSLTPREARALLPADIALGFSAHAGDDLDPWRDSDYLLLGPVFETASKQGLREALGLDGFARELARSPRPVWAIGGITPERAPEVLATGCAGLAVRGGIFGAPDPARSTAEFLARQG